AWDILSAPSSRFGPYKNKGPRMPTNRSKTAPKDHGNRPPSNHKSAFNRSPITNGKNLVHKQSLWARRFYDINRLYASDQGGDAHLSEARRSIIRRIACLQVELELLETRFAMAGGAEGLTCISEPLATCADCLRASASTESPATSLSIRSILRRLLTRRRRPHEHHPGLGRPPRLQAVVP